MLVVITYEPQTDVYISDLDKHTKSNGRDTARPVQAAAAREKGNNVKKKERNRKRLKGGIIVLTWK